MTLQQSKTIKAVFRRLRLSSCGIYSTAKGFTTVELLIAMQMTLLLAGFIYAIYFSSAKLSANWRQRVELENSALICMRTLTQDILSATQIISAQETELILTNRQDHELTFQVQHGFLYRNQQPLNSADVQIYKLVFRYIKNDSSAEKQLMRINAPVFFHPKNAFEMAQSSLIEIEMIFGNEKKRLLIKSTVHPRNIHHQLFDLL